MRVPIPVVVVEVRPKAVRRALELLRDVERRLRRVRKLRGDALRSELAAIQAGLLEAARLSDVAVREWRGD